MKLTLASAFASLSAALISLSIDFKKVFSTSLAAVGAWVEEATLSAASVMVGPDTMVVDAALDRAIPTDPIVASIIPWNSMDIAHLDVLEDKDFAAVATFEGHKCFWLRVGAKLFANGAATARTAKFENFIVFRWSR